MENYAKSVVITGSSRGIGYGLAREFLAAGCVVTLNGRNEESLSTAAVELGRDHDRERVTSAAGDVTKGADLQRLWQTAVERFGRVDIWINNAGIGHPMHPVWLLSEEKIAQVIDINLQGSVYGCRVAVPRMIEQGFGHIYNMEGFGSNGRVRAGISVYGSTKAAIRFLTTSLAVETADSPVKVSALSPGMVITDFMFEQFEDDPQGFESAKAAFNMLGDRVETVTPFLVRRMLANTKSGNRIEWLTLGKILRRVLAARFRRRRIVEEVLQTKPPQS